MTVALDNKAIPGLEGPIHVSDKPGYTKYRLDPFMLSVLRYSLSITISLLLLFDRGADSSKT